jgi:divalent metal cation (Fe/Co/Zn/Cd) transporter
MHLAKHVDVIVHMEPKESQQEEPDIYNYLQRLKTCDTRIVSLHNIRIHEFADGIHLAADLEMQSDITLNEAHDISDDLERRIKEDFEQVRMVHFHLESTKTETKSKDITTAEQDMIVATKVIVENETPATDCHNIVLNRDDHGVTISMDCRIHGDITLEESHDVATLIERIITQRFKEITSVFVHVEPL